MSKPLKGKPLPVVVVVPAAKAATTQSAKAKPPVAQTQSVAAPARTVQIAPARAAAFHILRRVAASAAHSDDLLHSVTVDALSAEDRNLTTALVLGVLRWQLYLDALLQPMMQRPDAELHPAALLALRLGLFQVLYMDRVPPHAVLHDSVELVRANGAPHAAGMVNAVLRRVLRERTATAARPPAGLSPAEQAHPDWMILRWRHTFGSAATRLIAAYDQAAPPAHALFAPGADVPDIDDGSRLVAELAAASVAHPTRVLDCCAAPGGKTAVLALRHPEATIVAADISEKRLDAMRKRLDRNPVTARVETAVVDMTLPSSAGVLQDGFDLILCDAPCSGTGTLARNPEIRHRLRPSDLARQAERQIALLTNALRLLRAGGRLVYSTCSLEPEENEAVVRAVLSTVEDVTRVDVGGVLRRIADLASTQTENAVHQGALRTLPGSTPCDGFYAVVLERAG